MIYLPSQIFRCLFRWKLNFNEHINIKIGKARKESCIIKKLQQLPKKPLFIIFKSSARPHVDDGDVICDQPNNDSFSDKPGKIQYSAALIIAGPIKGISCLCWVRSWN